MGGHAQSAAEQDAQTQVSLVKCTVQGWKIHGAPACVAVTLLRCCAADSQGYAEPAAAPDAQQQADNVRFTESLLPDWAAAASGPYPGAMPQALPPGSLPGAVLCCTGDSPFCLCMTTLEAYQAYQSLDSSGEAP